MRPKLSDLEIQRALGSLPGWSRRGDTLTKTYTFEKFAEGIAFIDSELDGYLDYEGPLRDQTSDTADLFEEISLD